MDKSKNVQLIQNIQKLYEPLNKELLFHGWHHIEFVARKAVEFASEIGNVNQELVEAAALTHDLNYIIDRKSEAEAGQEMRAQQLALVGFSTAEITEIDDIVVTSSITNRDSEISDAAKALSDADCLYKILPISLVTFSSKYIQETGVDLRQWADRIIKYQRPLLDQGIYFYTESANRKYLDWAKKDIEFVELISASLQDPDIQMLLKTSQDLGIL